MQCPFCKSIISIPFGSRLATCPECDQTVAAPSVEGGRGQFDAFIVSLIFKFSNQVNDTLDHNTGSTEMRVLKAQGGVSDVLEKDTRETEQQ